LQCIHVPCDVPLDDALDDELELLEEASPDELLEEASPDELLDELLDDVSPDELALVLLDDVSPDELALVLLDDVSPDELALVLELLTQSAAPNTAGSASLQPASPTNNAMPTLLMLPPHTRVPSVHNCGTAQKCRKPNPYRRGEHRRSRRSHPGASNAR
jgi:hypothetical protein